MTAQSRPRFTSAQSEAGALAVLLPAAVTTGGGGLDTCGTGPTFCIIDTRLASTYCGADCSQGQSCPRGYGCRDIRVGGCLIGQNCTPSNGLTCAEVR
jgi:hypothetical protein